MNYVLDENGNIKIGPTGKPLVKGADGKEFEIDAIGAQEHITTLNTESAGYRKRAQSAEKTLKTFEGIEDPVAALEAIKTVSTLGDDHKANMTKLRAELEGSYKSALDGKDAEIAELNGSLYTLNVTNQFNTSPVVKGTIFAKTPDIAATYFGKHFQQDGTAQDSAGNVIYSKENPGQPAGFDEALEVIIDQYPMKDNILLSDNSPGGGGHQSQNHQQEQTLSSRDSIKAGLEARK